MNNIAIRVCEENMSIILSTKSVHPDFLLNWFEEYHVFLSSIKYYFCPVSGSIDGCPNNIPLVIKEADLRAKYDLDWSKIDTQFVELIPK